MICVMPVRNTVPVIYILIYYTGKNCIISAITFFDTTIIFYSAT